MKLKLFTFLLASLAMNVAWADEPPKPIRVLLIGNSQCPTIVGNQLLEKLAASDKGGRPIKVGGCIKGGASLRSHWDAGTGEGSARAMIASGSWDFVVPIVDASYAYIRYFGDKPSTERLESLFAKDRAHPGLWGSYLYSCMIYSVLTERSPIGLAAPETIPVDVAKTLQETAWAQHQETAAALKK